MPEAPPIRPGRPEVLAPAGDPLALRAAVAAGADAVYLGMARFNARGRAERFRGVTLEACVRAAHSRGARVYVTLNTLLHEDEIEPALALAREALRAGADAAIVQDAGFAALLREELPELPLHGSTQMTIHQPDQAAEAVERLGLRRVILARECTLDEAQRIADRIRPLGAGAEVFVHGALCFAYSGQCLMSNLAGRRSANRGVCAQNCRFDFTEGPRSSDAAAESTAAEDRYLELPVFDRRKASQLISMKDLAAFESVASLADRGVESFKIEGRLKGPEYVAEVVRLYRSALDAWERGTIFDAAEAGRAAGRVYSRGFTNGYLAGGEERGPGRFDGMRGDKRRLEGEPDALVLSANRVSGSLLLEPREGHAIRPGQGYRYAHGGYRGGFRVIAVKPVGGDALVRARFGAEASGRRHRRGAAGRRRPPPPLPVGLACYLNSDPEISERIASLVAGVEIVAAPRSVPMAMKVGGIPGAPLRIEGSAAGHLVEVASERPLDEARGRALTEDILAEHLGRLGGTGYELGSLDASGLAPNAFATFPALHELRRRLVAALDAASAGAAKDAARAAIAPARGAAEAPAVGRAPRTGVAVCVRDLASYEAALEAGAARVIIEADTFLSKEAEWREALRSAAEAWFRLPPIRHDPREDRAALEAVLRSCARPGILAGHFGQLALARELGLAAAADLYLNAYNRRTLEVLGRSGARRVTLSLEVDAKEAARVAGIAPPGMEVEVVVGGEVFSMLTRQPFGLSPGEGFAAVSEHGHAYRFEADASGTTTLFEARELVGARALPALAGKVDSLRLDIASHPAAAIGEITRAYVRAVEILLLEPASPGAKAAVEAAREAHARHAPGGVFTGHLIRGARAQD